MEVGLWVVAVLDNIYERNELQRYNQALRMLKIYIAENVLKTANIQNNWMTHEPIELPSVYDDSEFLFRKE